jgi:dihydrofolate synthase/folylpolyglutamate synthase
VDRVAPDLVFFREWDSRLPGQRRSLDRARSLRDHLGLASYRPAVLTVVGSKGKGTTANYASAYLAAGGHRVVTVTSPSLRSPTERIRLDGTAVADSTLARLGQVLAAGIRQLPPHLAPGAGYLSPSGLFTLAGLLLARERSADYLVLEAGRGGGSDEVSLVEPMVVAITPIFGEHQAELGGSLAAIVADKAGVVGPGTAAVVVGRQPDPATARLVRAAAVARSSRRRAVEPFAPDRPELPDRLLPPGLGRANARLGCLAAVRLLAVTGRPQPARAAVGATLGSVSLPGRLSVHDLPGTGTQVLADAAVSSVGYRTAVGYARARLGGIDHVLLCLPDGKDLAGAVGALAGLPVTFVTVPASHLSFTQPPPPGWGSASAVELDRDYLSGLGRRVLALGTFSFVGRVLTTLDVPTGAGFRPAPVGPAGATRRAAAAGRR